MCELSNWREEEGNSVSECRKEAMTTVGKVQIEK